MEIVFPLCMYPLVFSFSVAVYDLPGAMFYHVGILQGLNTLQTANVGQEILANVGSLPVD